MSAECPTATEQVAKDNIDPVLPMTVSHRDGMGMCKVPKGQKCIVCGDKSFSDVSVCLICRKVMHSVCVNRWLAVAPVPTCPACRIEVQLPPNVIRVATVWEDNVIFAEEDLVLENNSILAEEDWVFDIQEDNDTASEAADSWVSEVYNGIDPEDTWIPIEDRRPLVYDPYIDNYDYELRAVYDT